MAATEKRTAVPIKAPRRPERLPPPSVGSARWARGWWGQSNARSKIARTAGTSVIATAAATTTATAIAGPKAARKLIPEINKVKVAPAIISAAVKITGNSSAVTATTAGRESTPSSSRWR